MGSIRDEVDDVLSLREGIDLSHPSRPLQASFVTEALHPVLAARDIKDRLNTGEEPSIVSDWTYIVESSKTLPLSFCYPP